VPHPHQPNQLPLQHPPESGPEHQNLPWHRRFLRRLKNGFNRRRSLWLILIALLIIAVVVVSVLASRALTRLDSRIQQVFDGPKWSIPARVYARPLELYQGLAVPQPDITSELQALGYREQALSGAGQFNTAGNRLSIQTRGFKFADGVEPPSTLLLRWQGNTISEMLDSKGNDVPIARLEPILIGRVSPSQGEDRLLVNLEQLPDGLLDTLLAVEDPKFYEHPGISLRGIARALWVNLKERRFAQGGSTLTQQLIKNLFLTRERTLKRKLTEWPMAIMLERRYSKDDILHAFINEVYFAQDNSRAIHGFGLASLYFFDTPIQDLEPHQIALLVGLLKGPSYYSPINNPERALSRRNLVLRIMANAGLLSETELQSETAKDLGISSRQNQSRQQHAYIDLVRQQLTRDYSVDDLHKNGLSIFTNFDPQIQRALEASLDEAYGQIAVENALSFEQLEKLQTAAIVTRADTGEVAAMLGGRSARFAGFNRAVDARRQIGSLIKPFIYLTALQQHERYHLGSVVQDIPVALPQPDGSIWTPGNYNGASMGAVPLLDALTHSYNLAAVNTGLELGIESIISTVQSLNSDITPEPLPSLLLGAIELSVVDVAALYQTLASSGFITPLRTIREIIDINGETLQRYPLRVNQAIDEVDLHLLNYALQNVMRAGTGIRAYRYLPPSLRVAGKSGTTNDQRDSWFAGFGGDYSTVVWMGHDDNTPTPVTGSRGALELWARTMARINRQSLPFSAPPDVRYDELHWRTGTLSNAGCPGTLRIPFHRDYAPAAGLATGIDGCP